MAQQENVDYQSSGRLFNLSFLEYLKLYFFEYEHVAMNSTCHGLDTATIGKPASLAALAVLVTGASQSRQHGDLDNSTSNVLIPLDSWKSGLLVYKLPLSDNEDANEHIEKVLEIVDLFHVPNITVDQLMLRVFLISLIGAARHWLRNEPTGSIKTWEDLKTKFLNKYCPPSRTAKKMEEFNNFQQEPDETLYQAWERFKELLMKCPQHYLTEMQEVILFYNGLDIPTRQILDSRGAIPTKTTKDAKKAI
ncbi:hypothetical protein Tco_1219771 [Tanacetum coccineum]